MQLSVTLSVFQHSITISHHTPRQHHYTQQTVLPSSTKPMQWVINHQLFIFRPRHKLIIDNCLHISMNTSPYVIHYHPPLQINQQSHHYTKQPPTKPTKPPNNVNFQQHISMLRSLLYLSILIHLIIPNYRHYFYSNNSIKYHYYTTTNISQQDFSSSRWY